MVLREKERFGIRAVQLDNLRGLGIKRTDIALNAWIKELNGVKKGHIKGMTKAAI